MIKKAVLSCVGYGIGIDVIAIDGFGAESSCCKGKDAASAADIEDGLVEDVRGHELEGEACGGM